MKRLITFCLTLVLALSLCVPASAADLAGPLGESAKPHIIDTGRGYVLYYEGSTAMFFSMDRQDWTALPDRAWIEEGTHYNPFLYSPYHSKSYQIIWTGTEYMMCQCLRDSPRDVDPRRCDSPRNKMVTFLDTDWNVIGVKVFDAPVTAIRCQDGVYYATVDTVEHAFARSEWDFGSTLDENGRPLGDFYIGRFQEGYYVDDLYLIHERPDDSLYISWDGRSWVPLESIYINPQRWFAETNGGSIVYYNAYSGEAYYYQIKEERIFGSTGKWEDEYWGYTGGWKKIDFGFDPTEGIYTPFIRYTFRWTGNGYLMCQSAGVRGLAASLHEDEIGAWDTYVSFLDEEFHRTGAHDFGAPVTGVAWREGVYYAEVTEPGGEPVIYQSQDGETWTVSPMTALPSLEPVSPDAFPDWPGREYLLSPLTPRVYQPQVKPHKEIPTWSISRPNGF